MRDTMREYLENHAKMLAISLALERKSTEHIADVMDTITSAFDELDAIYGKKPEKVDKSPR